MIAVCLGSAWLSARSTGAGVGRLEDVTFSGLIPALLTPFDDDLALAPERLAENLDGLAGDGIRSVVVNGTMGEAGALSAEERGRVIETAVADSRVTVTVGVSAHAPAHARAYAEQAAALGATGVMCLPPLLYPAEDRELEAFFEQVAAAGLPIMLYNNPPASGTDLTPERIARLAEAQPAITAVKECSGDARRIAHLLELTDLQILIGGDDWALEGYAAGAHGWVSGVANAYPRECLELERSALDGDLAAARGLWARLAAASRLDMDPRLVQFFKAMLDATGRHGGPTRPPRMALDDAGRALVEAALAAADTTALQRG